VAQAPLAAVFATDFLVARARGFAGLSRVEAVLLGIALAIVLGAAACFATRSGRGLVRGHAKHVLALAACLALVVLGLEIALERRARIFERTRFHRRLPHTDRVFTPDPQTYRGASRIARYTTSSLGVRGPELPATRGEATRILCLGSSMTECLDLDDERTWPALLAAWLGQAGKKVWVGNVGISGFSTWEHLPFVRHSELMEEIDALVVLCGITDLQTALTRGRSVAEPLFRRSRLKEALIDAAEGPDSRRWTYDVGIFAPGLSMLEAFREPRRHATFVDALPDLDAELVGYGERLRAIAAAAQRRGVRPVFATQPTLWVEGLPRSEEARCWFGWLDDGRTRYLSGRSFRVALARTNGALREAAREAGAACVELGSLDGRPELFEDDCHLTEAGAREVARLVAEAFAQ
jgi:hypothetical protein